MKSKASLSEPLLKARQKYAVKTNDYPVGSVFYYVAQNGAGFFYDINMHATVEFKNSEMFELIPVEPY